MGKQRLVRIRLTPPAVKLRRFGKAGNSGEAAKGVATPRAADAVKAGTSGEEAKGMGRRSGMTIRSFTHALECKLQTGECLTLVGTEGFVRRAISRMDRCSRNAQRRIMRKNAMSITPLSPAASSQEEDVTGVSSQ